MTARMMCGNDPRARLTPGDRAEVARFRAYLAEQLLRLDSPRVYLATVATIVHVSQAGTVHVRLLAWDHRRTIPVPAWRIGYETGFTIPPARGQRWIVHAHLAAKTAAAVDPHAWRLITGPEPDWYAPPTLTPHQPEQPR